MNIHMILDGVTQFWFAFDTHWNIMGKEPTRQRLIDNIDKKYGFHTILSETHNPPM